MIQIITDSTADLPADIARREGIIVVPCQVTFGEESFREDVDLTNEAFFRKLRTAATLPKTSLPRGEDFTAAYREAEERGASEIIAIHIGSAFSGVYNAARLFTQNADVPTRIVDSGTTSLAMGLLARYAARRAAEDAPFDVLGEELERLAAGAEVHAMLDTLEYIRRGGRVGRITEAFASVFNIKPVLRVANNSVDLVSRHRSSKRAFNSLVDTVREAHPQHGVSIVHADAPERAHDLADRIRPLLSDASDLIVHPAGAVLSTHAGPGAVAVTFVR